jgi:hypothetical protein
MIDCDIEDEGCPKCGETLAYRRCEAIGCEDGMYEDDDGVNGVEYYSCDDCLGLGYQEWCRECGWDNVFKCFLQPKYEQEWLEKQKSLALQQS